MLQHHSLDSFSSGYGALTKCFEYSSEPSGSVKEWQTVLYSWSTWYPLQKQSAVYPVNSAIVLPVTGYSAARAHCVISFTNCVVYLITSLGAMTTGCEVFVYSLVLLFLHNCLICVTPPTTPICRIVAMLQFS